MLQRDMTLVVLLVKSEKIFFVQYVKKCQRTQDFARIKIISFAWLTFHNISKIHRDAQFVEIL
jgi:hypothetical protein